MYAELMFYARSMYAQSTPYLCSVYTLYTPYVRSLYAPWTLYVRLSPIHALFTSYIRLMYALLRPMLCYVMFALYALCTLYVHPIYTPSTPPPPGLSVCYVSAVVIVAYYFERRRSLATGISVCGTGAGTFIFPPLVELLLQVRREILWRAGGVLRDFLQGEAK